MAFFEGLLRHGEDDLERPTPDEVQLVIATNTYDNRSAKAVLEGDIHARFGGIRNVSVISLFGNGFCVLRG